MANDLCQMADYRHICHKNAGIPRKEMPQFHSSVLNNFLTHLHNKCHTITETVVPAHKLRMTQKDACLKTIHRGMKRNPCDRPVIVIADHDINDTFAILDGHHGALACRMLGGEQRVIVIDHCLKKHLLYEIAHNEKILEILREAISFDGVESGLTV